MDLVRIPPMSKRVFSEADKVAAKNLKALWKTRAKELGLTQEKAGGELGMNQSAVSQYLAGQVPLRITAALKFAKILKVKPVEIRPDLAELTNELSPEALDWAQRFDKLDERGKRRFEAALLLAFPAIPDERLESFRAPEKPSKKHA